LRENTLAITVFATHQALRGFTKRQVEILIISVIKAIHI
jgi:hypothetical protein